MPANERRNTRQLFKDWRSGDGQAGQLMAQQVADWYYAIATSRLGERRGRAPCDAACAAFGTGIVEVTESRKLIPWAHSLIVEELKSTGEARATDGDDPSAYTGSQRPKALLLAARSKLPKEIELLEVVYGADADRSRIEALAEPLGGNPLGILKARYAIKRWLRDHRNVPFEVAPDEPVLDRAPLPLYEADRMASSAEEAQFEQWMLTDIDLCKDIAEFAHFSIALRGGLPSQEQMDAKEAAAIAAKRAQAEQQAARSAPVPARETPTEVAPESSSGGPPMALIIGGVIALVLLLVVVAAIGIGLSMM